MKDSEPLRIDSDVPVNTGIPRQSKFKFTPHTEVDPKEVLRRTGRLDLGSKGALPSGVYKKFPIARFY